MDLRFSLPLTNVASKRCSQFVIPTEVFMGLRPTYGDENVLKGTGFRVCVRTGEKATAGRSTTLRSGRDDNFVM
jgi:hypothetical protein